MTSRTARTYNTSGDRNQFTQIICDSGERRLKSFEYIDHHNLDLEQDIDPDCNFFSSIDKNCCYYTDEQYNKVIKHMGKLSIIHFNSRSLYANFKKIKDYLNTFTEHFDVIAISETWMNIEKGIDFGMEGYEFIYKNRENKGGGGVAIYIDEALDFKVIEQMTTVVDDTLECLSI